MLNEQRIEQASLLNEFEQELKELDKFELGAYKSKAISRPTGINKERLFKTKDDMWLNIRADTSIPMAIKTLSL